MDISWEITLSDGRLISSEDRKFNLAWFLPGEVSSFRLFHGEENKEYKINIPEGIFMIDGKSIKPRDISGKDVCLRYYVKNIVHFNASGGEIQHIRIPHIGYSDKEGEQIYIIGEGFEWEQKQ